MQGRREHEYEPCLYALLLDAPGLRLRLLSYRAEEREEQVPGSLAWAPQGTPVLLRGRPYEWRGVLRAIFTRWKDPPSVEALRAGRVATVRVSPRDVRGGQCSADALGRACELGDHESDAHGAVGVVSYAGWRLEDLPATEVDAIVTVVGAQVYYVIPSRSVPEVLVAPEPSGRPVAVGGAVVKAPPPPPAERPLDVTVPLERVHFLDGSLTVFIEDVGPLQIAEPRSRHEFEAIKPDLKKHLPAGVRVTGTLRRGGRHRVAIADLGALDEIFRVARRTEYLQRISRERRWMGAREVLRELGEEPEGAGVLTIPELGLDRRGEAFARLFRLRDPSREVQIQPNEAMLVPVPATDGGPAFWVWEMVEEGNATYLFRPRTQAMAAHLFEWLGAPQMSRRELLESGELREKVGFVARVIHREVDEPLDAWWERLCAALGRRPHPG